MPEIEAGVTGAKPVDLDSAGLAALNEYLTSTAKQVRLFYRTRLELTPGQPIPAGELAGDALLTMDATGTLR